MQAADTRLDQIAHRRRTLPEVAELADLDQRGGQLRDALVAARTEADDVQREVTKAEADVEVVRARAARNQARLDAGQGSHKELEGLQHELQTLARRQSDLEDVELEVMERLESAQGEAARLAAEAAEHEQSVAAVTERRRAADAELDAEQTTLQATRTGLAAGLDQALLTLYEKLRGDLGGIGAALLQHHRCGGCRLELTPQELGEIRRAGPDDVVRHEDCRRILVRTVESGL